MQNTIDLRPREAAPKVEKAVKAPRSKFSIYRNYALSGVLLLSIIFSSVKILQAQGVTAPDPGHLWSEIGDVLVAVAQGGTGLSSLGAADAILAVNSAGDALEYRTLDTSIVPESVGGNFYYTPGRFDNDFALKTTSDLAEGSNLYWTDARFDARLASKTTGDLAEGSNLYWTDARFDTRLASKTTTDLAEGINLYFTNARARSAISASAPIAYNSSTGVISLNTVGINRGGTGQTTANAGFNALAPSQAGNAGRFLTTSGTNTSWAVVDKNTVGLGNVENTALSTWAGSSNVVNLGSVITGSWQATPIADPYIASSASWNAKENGIAPGTALQYFRGDKTWALLDTLAVPENGNLYWTDARFDTRLASKTTTDLAEGVNLYWTDTRFDDRLASKTSDDLAEGLANLFWTDTRFNDSFAFKTTDDLIQGAVNLYYDASREGAADGLATLDSDGKVPKAQLKGFLFKGIYEVLDISERDSLPVEPDEFAIAIVADAGSGDSRSYAWNGSSWIELKSTTP